MFQNITFSKPSQFASNEGMKPTTWKTSFPISMPIEASSCVVVSMGYFTGCCGVVPADFAGEATGPSH
jgi:hypothetical protein